MVTGTTLYLTYALNLRLATTALVVARACGGTKEPPDPQVLRCVFACHGPPCATTTCDLLQAPAKEHRRDSLALCHLLKKPEKGTSAASQRLQVVVPRGSLCTCRFCHQLLHVAFALEQRSCLRHLVHRPEAQQLKAAFGTRSPKPGAETSYRRHIACTLTSVLLDTLDIRTERGLQTDKP